MFFLFYPNAAYALSLPLFPVSKVIHVPGCWFIHEGTFIAHSAALAMFLWHNESSVLSFVAGFFVCSPSWDYGCGRPWGLLALLGCPQEGPVLSQPIWFLLLWFFKPVSFNVPQLSTLKKMRLCSEGTLWLIRKCLSRKALLQLFGVPSMW